MNKYRNNILKGAVFYFGMFMIMAVLCPMTVLASDTEEQKTVRVGYVNVTNYEEGGEGEYKRGAGYEYLQKISYRTGWKYEYVYGSFKECLEMLAKGEIDLFGDVTYTPERAELIDFSTYPQGKGTYWLYAGNDRTDLTTGDIDKLNGCRIGVTEGSYQEGLLSKWLQDNQIQAETVLCEGYEELMKKLDAGELDKVKELLDQTEMEFRTVPKCRFCSNVVVDGAIAVYCDRAAEQNVEFQTEIQMPEKTDKLNEFEFATVLMNLLDNALRSAACLSERNNRKVKIRIKPVKSQLLVEVSNTFKGDTLKISKITGLPVSERGSEHGFGMKSIKAYADKYHAVFQYSVENGKFCVRLLTEA